MMRGENIFDKLEHKLKKYYKFEDPYALEWGEWDGYRARYKKTHPIMYFVFQTVINNIDRFLHRYIIEPWNNFWYSLRNRFIDHSTEVRIQSLKKYRYHDPSKVLLHANFQILVDFVELEVGIFDRSAWYDALRSIPIIGYFIPSIRDADGGLKHLQWECELKHNEEWVKPDDPLYNKPTPQAISAREKRDLYLWWKNIRPQRLDPMDASGLSNYYEKMRNDGRELFGNNKTDEERIIWNTLSNQCQSIEKMYDEEDERNLIRLIKIRQSLWT